MLTPPAECEQYSYGLCAMPWDGFYRSSLTREDASRLFPGRGRKRKPNRDDTTDDDEDHEEDVEGGSKAKGKGTVVNYYEVINKNGSKHKYFNPNPHAPQHPFRMIICGPSGGGKTVIALNCLDICKNFDQVEVWGRDVEQDLYKFLAENSPPGMVTLHQVPVTLMGKRKTIKNQAKRGKSADARTGRDQMEEMLASMVEKASSSRMGQFSRTPTGRKLAHMMGVGGSVMARDEDDDKPLIDPVDTLKKDNKQKLIIFDDLIADPYAQAIIADYFIRLRHLNASVINIAHSFFAVPKLTRLSATHVLLVQGTSKDDIMRILRECNLAVDKKQLHSIYREAIQNPNEKFPFLYIDLNVNESNKRFRNAFGEYFTIEGDPDAEDHEAMDKLGKKKRKMAGDVFPVEDLPPLKKHRPVTYESRRQQMQAQL